MHQLFGYFVFSYDGIRECPVYPSVLISSRTTWRLRELQAPLVRGGIRHLREVLMELLSDGSRGLDGGVMDGGEEPGCMGSRVMAGRRGRRSLGH